MNELEGYLTIRKAILQYLDWVYIGKGGYPPFFTQELIGMMKYMFDECVVKMNYQDEEIINRISTNMKRHAEYIKEFMTVQPAEEPVFKMDDEK